MTALEQLQRVKRRLSLTAATHDALISDLVTDAANFVMAYTAQATVPAALDSAVTELAVMLYNKQGLEGQASHSEGGVSISVDTLPPGLKQQLDSQRLARVVSAWS